MCMQIFMKALREGLSCYKSLLKHKTTIEDLDNIIQDFETVRFTLRYTSVNALTAQTRSWFISLISAAVASVTEIPIAL